MSHRYVSGTRDAVWVTGPDAVSFLHGLLSQDIEGMEPGEVRRSFLLGPQGKLRALLWVVRLSDDRVLLVTDRGSGSTVASDLLMYRIRVKVEIAAASEPIWEGWGDGAAAAAGAVVGRAVESGSGVVLALTGFDVVVGIGVSVPNGWEEAEPSELTAERIDAGEPVYGVDVDESTIPQETGLVSDAVSFEKGCYLGQELVARIDSRGHVNRHLRRVRFDASSPDVAGADILAGDKVVGRLTSVARFGDGSLGLGMVRREIDPGSPVILRTDGGDVAAVVLERA